MPFVDILPDQLEVEAGSRTLVGAASALLCLNDSSDSTYVQLAGTVDQSWWAWFRFAQPTIPAGASITGVQLMYRFSHWTHAPGSIEMVYARRFSLGHLTAGGTVQDLVSDTENPYYWSVDSTSVAQFAASIFQYIVGWHVGFFWHYNNETLPYNEKWYVEVLADRQAANNLARIYRVVLRVYYDLQPVLNITSPAGGTIQTARPQFTWSWNDPDGKPQEVYDVRIFEKADADAADFNGLENSLSETYPPVYRGFAVTSAQSHLVGSSFAENGVEYSAFIRARHAMIWPLEQYALFPAKSPNTLWDRVDFTPDFDGPQAPTIVATANAVDHSIAVDVVGIDNVLTFNQSTLELTTTEGWIQNNANTTIANVSTPVLDGARSLRMTRNTTTGDAQAATTPSMPVIAGNAYSAQAWFRAATTGRTVKTQIAWFGSNNALISTTTSAHDAVDNTTGWVQTHGWGTAPVGAVWAQVYVTAVAAVATEQHYVDRVALFQGIRNNLLTDNQASLEEGTTGWTAGTNTTIAQVMLMEAAYDRNAVLELTRTTSTGSGTANIPTGTSGIPVTVGTQYTVAARFRAPVTVRQGQVTLNWYLSGGGANGSASSGLVTDTTTGWTTVSVTATAPASTVFASITVTVASMAVSEKHYVDGIGLWPADTPGLVPAWNLGGFLNEDALIHQMELQRSIDAGVTWESLPEQRVEHIPLQQTLHYHDFEIASGGTGHYRARIIAPNQEGIVMNSPWSKTVNATLPMLTRFYLRDPLDSTGEMNMILRVVSLDKEFPKPLAQGFPLESDASAVTHRGIRKPNLRIVVDLLNEDDYMMFHDMMNSGNVLLLNDVIGEQHYLQLLDLSEERLQAVKDPGEMWPMRHAHRATCTFASVDRDTSFALHSSAGMSSMGH